jgi:lipid-binding SYLF domain-containing protein
MLRTLSLVLLLCAAALAGCTTAPRTPLERMTLVQESEQTMRRAIGQNADVKYYLARSPAYAVFPTMGKGGFVFGGGYGKGVLYENGTLSGFCDATQLTLGAQIGGQTYTEMLFFEDAAAVAVFKSGKLALNAQVAAVAADHIAAKRARYQNGVALVILDSAGLMAEAAVGGQEFRYQVAQDK